MTSADRVEELVAEAGFYDDDGCDRCAIVTELAAIARTALTDLDAANARADEAEAMCEWLVNNPNEWLTNCPELAGDDGLPCMPEPGPTHELCRKHRVAAAREAVRDATR
jgi:hypothetical protein